MYLLIFIFIKKQILFLSLSRQNVNYLSLTLIIEWFRDETKINGKL